MDEREQMNEFMKDFIKSKTNLNGTLSQKKAGFNRIEIIFVDNY